MPYKCDYMYEKKRLIPHISPHTGSMSEALETYSERRIEGEWEANSSSSLSSPSICLISYSMHKIVLIHKNIFASWSKSYEVTPFNNEAGRKSKSSAWREICDQCERNLKIMLAKGKTWARIPALRPWSNLILCRAENARPSFVLTKPLWWSHATKAFLPEGKDGRQLFPS